jgi:hypothetical protein
VSLSANPQVRLGVDAHAEAREQKDLPLLLSLARHEVERRIVDVGFERPRRARVNLFAFQGVVHR